MKKLFIIIFFFSLFNQHASVLSHKFMTDYCNEYIYIYIYTHTQNYQFIAT